MVYLFARRKCMWKNVKRSPSVASNAMAGGIWPATAQPPSIHAAPARSVIGQTDTCKNTAQPHCMSCGTAAHASWARTCPVFQRKCNEMNNRLEDNNMLYFPTAELWMQVREPPKVVYMMPPLPWPAQCSRNNNGTTQSTLPWKTVGASTRGAPPSSQQPPRQAWNDNSSPKGLPPMTHPHE